jgi:hypothetical protein
VSAAVDLITDRVRERVRREGVDLAADSTLADRFVREELRSYSERALGGTAPLIADEQAAARTIIVAVTGLGPLQPLLDDPIVEEVWINAPDRIFLARNGVSERIQLDLTEADVRDLVERMLRSTGRRAWCSRRSCEPAHEHRHPFGVHQIDAIEPGANLLDGIAEIALEVGQSRPFSLFQFLPRATSCRKSVLQSLAPSCRPIVLFARCPPLEDSEAASRPIFDPVDAGLSSRRRRPSLSA